MLLQSGDRILFIGDVGRREDPEGLGHGYVRMLRDMVWARYPERDIEFINRGISGDTVRNLEARWQQDVLDIKPTVLSISIGVNDVWSQPDDPLQVPLDQFESTYRDLLTQTRDALGCRLILCEATPIGEKYDTYHNPLLEPYNACVSKLAAEFDAHLVPMNQAFWRVIDANPGRAWTNDGVHPYSNGHTLMALTFFDILTAS